MGVWQRMYMMFKCSRLNRIVIPVHRFLGLAFGVQWVLAVLCWTCFPLKLYLATPLWLTLPVGGVLQGASAAYYFRYTTPKKMDPGFMSMGDVGRLSWFFVIENTFFSSLLAFQNAYYHPAWPLDNPLAVGGPARATAAKYALFLVEVLFVFLPYYWRPLFPKTALRDSHKHRIKNTNPANLDFYAKNTYVIKAFYNFAKHYIGFFLNYLRFLNRVNNYSHEHTTVYGIEILSSYMVTVAVFIHTLVFKNIVTNKQGALLYQAGYPFTFYLYATVGTSMIARNLDLALLSSLGLALNFASMRAFHTYQAAVMVLLFLWRDCFLDHPDNHFSAHNMAHFTLHLRARFDVASACLVCGAVLFVLPLLPKLARRHNPFYPLAARLAKAKPHHEDDPPATYLYRRPIER